MVMHKSLYTMARDEFSVFNYFQGHFKGNYLACEATSRYWDQTCGRGGHPRRLHL